jgi:septal ring-binding cell division protein DamX
VPAPSSALPAPAVAAAPTAAAARKLAALPRPLAAPGAPAKSPVSAALPATTRDAAKVAVTAKAATKEPSQPAKVGAASVPSTAAKSTAPGEKGKGRFLLQLSSFHDRAEADAFARRFGAQNAYVVATEIPGKGTWYRVRVGSYASLQEATAAKTTFEHDHNVIAYVAGSGPAK